MYVFNVMSRYISIITKKQILEKQNYKCATIKDYFCPMWKFNNGSFDESGFEFDHIDEYSLTKNNCENNIQALCHCCHSVKTKRFRNCKNELTTTQINNGCGLMEVVHESKRRKTTKYNDNQMIKDNDNQMIIDNDNQMIIDNDNQMIID